MECHLRVLQSSYGYKGQREVANCTECALHDLCNILLADSATGLFNLKFLPSTVKPLQEFQDFYTNYSSYTTINDSKAGQAWMNLLSNRNGIIYVQKNYEVECFADNILNLLNILFNIYAKSWKEFGELLSNEHRTISCKEKAKGKVTFTMGDNEFDLVVESGFHTYLNFPHRSSTTFNSISTDTCKLLFNEDKNTHLNALVPILTPPLSYCASGNSLSRYSLGLFASISEDRYPILAILQDITQKAKENPLLRETVMRLTKTLPDDHDYKLITFRAFIASGAYESSEECLNFIKTYPQAAPVRILADLLKCCIQNPEVGIDQIKLLLNRGAKVSHNILYEAIRNKCSVEIMKELIKKEHFLAPSCELDWYHKDNLMTHAIVNGRIDVANLLLNMISSSDDNNYLKRSLVGTISYPDSRSPLEFALSRALDHSNNHREQHLEIAKKLIALGALVNAGSKLTEYWISLVSQYQQTGSLVDILELVKAFCEKGDVNMIDARGNSILLNAITCLKSPNSAEKKSYCYSIIDLLLKAGAKPTCITNDGKRISALTLATQMKDKELEALIRSSKAK